ncbi:MAG: DUF4185 domain-containing protein [Bryobacteraceae bacterium]
MAKNSRLRSAGLRFALVSTVLFVLPGGEALAQTAQAWPEADRLFHGDPLWRGGDAAYSVDLGAGRVLWLFGDSFVATAPGQTRRESTFTRNTIAIETGYDPSRASLRFYWRKKSQKPASFFPERGANWLWPMHGVRLGNALLVFLSVIGPDRNPDSLGFRLVGWTALLISNPDRDPAHWAERELERPANAWSVIIGASVLREGGFLYIYGIDEPRHDTYLLRLPEGAAALGKLSAWEWWCGPGRGWVRQKDVKSAPVPVYTRGSTEMSVQYDPKTHRYVELDSMGFGATDLVLRTADRPEGPWTPPAKVYRPPESDGADPFVYGGKAHPELLGADMVATYTANGSDERLASDMSIYYPRFVRINLPPAP